MIKIILSVLVLVLIGSAVAFPLSGNNSLGESTVFGAFNENGLLYVDMLSSDAQQVTLVDSEDRFINSGYLNAGNIADTYKFGPVRKYWTFTLPEGNKPEIKRLRITPISGDPYSIEWQGVPEVAVENITIKFYGLKEDNSGFAQIVDKEIKNWQIDVKLTNKLPTTQPISQSAFVVEDQFGYLYKVDMGDVIDLLPGESARLALVVSGVFKLSRPVFLVYVPEDLKMDVSAWV